MQEQEIIKKINDKIYWMVKEYEQTHEFNAIKTEHICGMLDTLEMFTGKSYYYDEQGVHER